MQRSTASVVLVAAVVALAGMATAAGAVTDLGYRDGQTQMNGGGVGSGTASVTFDDQTSDGTTVTVASANLSDGGFVVIHDSSLTSGDEGSAVSSVVGVSEYLSNGTHENVTVTLDEPITESQTLVAMPHRDTNDNQAFDFVAENGTVDGPYTADGGGPVTDSAEITVEEAPVTPSVTIENQTSDGTSVEVASASGEPPYYVAVWTQNETGAPDTILGYTQVTDTSVSNLSVAVEGLNESQELIAAVHPDADGNASTADDPVADDILASDTATVTVEEEPVATIAFEDQTSDGTSVEVASASNAEAPYYVAVWTQNETGAPDSILGFQQVDELAVSNLSVAVEGLNESQELIAAVHPDADGNASTADDPVADDILASDTATVTVGADGEEVADSFEVSDLSAPASVRGDEIAVVTATVSNPNAEADAQDVAYRFDGNVIAKRNVALNGGASTTVQFELNAMRFAKRLDSGTYVHGVFTREGGQVAEITIEDERSFEVWDLSAPANATAGENVTVSAEIKNPNFEETSQPVEFRLGGRLVETRNVTLDAADTETVTFEVDTTGVAPGTYIHGVLTPDDGQFATITVEEAPVPSAVTFENQTSDGTSVEVASASNAETPYYVAVWTQTENGTPDSILGYTQVNETNVTDLSVAVEGLNESQELIAAVHPDADGNASTADDPVADDILASDTATVTLETAPSASVTIEDQTSDGTSVEVASASGEPPYYVAVWTQNETGAPDTILGYTQVTDTSVSNLSVAVEGLNESQELIAAVHPDADGNASTADDPVADDILASDTATVTLDTGTATPTETATPSGTETATPSGTETATPSGTETASETDTSA